MATEAELKERIAVAENLKLMFKAAGRDNPQLSHVIQKLKEELKENEAKG